MTVTFHPDAETGFNKAIDYYKDCEGGLGYDFSVEVFAGIQNIVHHPTPWPVVEEGIRRCLVNRFPYGILYSTEPSGIFILAVMHMRRHPDYWKKRV